MISVSKASKQFPESNRVLIERYSEANVPTEYGTFRVVVYREHRGHGAGVDRRASPALLSMFDEHVAMVVGDVQGQDVLVRVHSECLTGEVMHSLKCDCREQLDRGMRAVAEEKRGVVMYLRQEGRGIGLGEKIRAYALQERGADTVDANRMLGLPDDARRYHVAAFMARDLGIESMQLLTNNPDKVRKLRAEGIPVHQRLPVYIEPNAHSVDYLLTKSRRMGHQLDIAGAAENEGEIDAAVNDAEDADGNAE